MKNKTLKTVLCVVVGLALFALVAEAASLLSQAFMLDDLLDETLKNGTVELYHDVKWSCVAVSSVIIVATVCNILALVSKGLGFKITSLAVNCVAIILSAVLMDVVHNDALYIGGTQYAVGAAYITETLQVVFPCALLAAYGTFDLVCTVRGKKSDNLSGAHTAITETEAKSNEEN